VHELVNKYMLLVSQCLPVESVLCEVLSWCLPVESVRIASQGQGVNLGPSRYA
jgi:hypothetical protein